MEDHWAWNQRIRLWVSQFTWAQSVKLSKSYHLDLTQQYISRRWLSHCHNKKGIQSSHILSVLRSRFFFSLPLKAFEIGMHLIRRHHLFGGDFSFLLPCQIMACLKISSILNSKECSLFVRWIDRTGGGMSGIFSVPPAQPSHTAHGSYLTSSFLEVKELSSVSERWLVRKCRASWW